MASKTVTGDVSSHFASYDASNYSWDSMSTSYPMENAYSDSDSTTYAQVSWKTGSGAETYVYMLFGISSSDIPAGATIKSVSASVKGYINTTSSQRVTTRQMQLCSGTTLKGSALTLSTSTSAQTFSSVGTWTRDEILNAGVRYYIKRGTSNATSAYQLRIYGGSVTVEYEYQQTTYTITINNVTEADVTASDTEPVEGDDVEIYSDTVTDIVVKDNGVDVTGQFVQASGDSISAVAESITTGFSSSNADFYMSSSQTGTDYLEYAVGHTAESPGSTGSNNTYVKDGGNNTATGWVNYHFDFSEIPMSASITSVSVKVYGARENSTTDSTHVAKFALYSGDTMKGSEQNFTSTSNGIVTVTSPGTWTREELQDAVLRFTVAYYGGRMMGITWTVTYEVSGYVYTISAVAGNHTIAVAYPEAIYVKIGGVWIKANAVYKKVNGAWVQQDELTGVFEDNVNYVKG